MNNDLLIELVKAQGKFEFNIVLNHHMKICFTRDAKQIKTTFPEINIQRKKSKVYISIPKNFDFQRFCNFQEEYEYAKQEKKIISALESKELKVYIVLRRYCNEIRTPDEMIHDFMYNMPKRWARYHDCDLSFCQYETNPLWISDLEYDSDLESISDFGFYVYF